MSSELKHCLTMIESEEQLARTAPSEEAAEMHQQMIMLYRAQLEHLRKAAAPGQEDWENDLVYKR